MRPIFNLQLQQENNIFYTETTLFTYIFNTKTPYTTYKFHMRNTLSYINLATTKHKKVTNDCACALQCEWAWLKLISEASVASKAYNTASPTYSIHGLASSTFEMEPLQLSA